MSQPVGQDPAAPLGLTPTVRKALPWTGTATVIMALASFLQFAAVARILGPSGAGEFALGLALVAPLMMLLGLGLRDLVQARRCGWDEYRQVLGLRLAASGVLVLCAFALQPFLGSLAPGFLPAMALWRAADLVQELVAGMLLRLGLPALSAAPIVGGQVIPTVAFTLGLLGGAGLAPATALGAGASLLVAIASLIAMALRRSKGTSALPTLGGSRGWLRMGLPLGLSGAITATTALAPRVVLERVDGSAAVGEFSAPLRLSAIPVVVFIAVAQAGLSPLVQAQGRRALLTRLYTGNAVVAAIAAVPMVLMPQALLTALFGPAFASPGTIEAVQILAVGNLVVSAVWVADAALISRSLFRARLLTSIGFVCATILACLLLVDPWGVPGAAWAVVIGYVVGLMLKVVAGAR